MGFYTASWGEEVLGSKGELKGGTEEWAGDKRGEPTDLCKTGNVHHPAPSPCAWPGLGWEGVPLSALQMGKKKTNLKSFLRFILSARHEEGDGECTVH